MNPPTNLRAPLIEARARLAQRREKLARHHAAGSLGVQICAQLTSLLDELVLEAFRDIVGAEALAGGRPEGIVLVAHGGYGRGDVSPYSDVDLMILYRPRAAGDVEDVARRLLSDLYDVGLEVGQSVRTPDQARQLSRADATIATSLMESRVLAGDRRVFDAFWTHFLRDIRRRRRRLLQEVLKVRGAERKRYGETVYLLEPHVKRSPGALRDIQMLRWLGLIRYGLLGPDELQLAGHLSVGELREIRRAHEFLVRLRHELHFRAGKSKDVLDRQEQVRLAEALGYHGESGIRPVEQFMREYFLHTSGVKRVLARLVAAAHSGSAMGKLVDLLFSHQVEGDFLVSPNHIVTTRRGLRTVTESLDQMLRLADLANLYDKRIADVTWNALCEAAKSLPDECSPQAAGRFLALLSQPTRLYELLRQLHELGVLQILIPAFRHARGLLQFNLYHQYTVDEHCLRAVLEATRFQQDAGPVGTAYRSIQRKHVLHLALLIHDLGKGYVEDHSEVGRQIADETARRLRLNPLDAQMLEFLVHRHLRMSHLAFRRDTSDENVLVNFAREVGSPEMLTCLFVLTAADIAAVGPDNLNDWKVDVLYDLYRRTMLYLAGGTDNIEPPLRLEGQRNRIRQLVRGQADFQWYDAQIEALPASWLETVPPDHVAGILRQLKNHRPGQVSAWCTYHADSGTLECTVGTYEDVTPGVFHKLTGALTSAGCQILSAEIHTLEEGLVLDRFRVLDGDFSGPPPAGRLEEVRRRLIESLNAPAEAEPTFRRLWTLQRERGAAGACVAVLPTEIRLDNSTSERCTIIDVFTHDRRGLLYRISRTIFALGLSVHVAKIGTYLDQVVDVFYVTDMAGRKIQDQDRLDRIRETLQAAVETFEEV